MFVALAIPAAVMAAKPAVENTPVTLSQASISSSAVQWTADGTYERLVLTVSGPDGFAITREFAAGMQPTLGVADLGKSVADGNYTWELRVVPRVAPQVRRKLQQAREAGNEQLANEIRAQAGLNRTISESGAFNVAAGQFVPGADEQPSTGPKVIATGVNLQPTPLDQVYADDVIVQGSLCVGLDCVDGESFGFDTIRLKENNTRIKFDDTSTTGGCPPNDWQLTANDACGGSSKFSIEDITGAKVPFTIIAGAPTNSLFVSSGGDVGLATSTPALDLHINRSDTPAIRLEQNNSGGFTAQTWDIGANEANFFVRDVTGGSLLSLRIRPGAPTSSLDIASTGFVGVGTSSPDFALDVTNNTITPLRITGNNNPGFVVANADVTKFTMGIPTAGGNFITGSAVNDVAFRADGSGKMLFSTSPTGATNDLTISAGNVGIGTTAPGSDLVIANGATTSSINAGSAQFTVASSRTFKENIEAVTAPDILSRIEAVPVVTYDFVDNGPKDRLGLIAEDFYKVFGRGDEKHIDGQDVQMALWLAVQKLTAENKELKDRLNSIESKVEQKQ